MKTRKEVIEILIEVLSIKFGSVDAKTVNKIADRLEQQPEVRYTDSEDALQKMCKKHKFDLTVPHGYIVGWRECFEWLQSHHPQPISKEKVKAIVKEITLMDSEYDVPFPLFQAVGSNTNCRIIYKKCLRAVELTLTELGLNKD